MRLGGWEVCHYMTEMERSAIMGFTGIIAKCRADIISLIKGLAGRVSGPPDRFHVPGHSPYCVPCKDLRRNTTNARAFETGNVRGASTYTSATVNIGSLTNRRLGRCFAI